jgi:hypothetical protein
MRNLITALVVIFVLINSGALTACALVRVREAARKVEERWKNRCGPTVPEELRPSPAEEALEELEEIIRP